MDTKKTYFYDELLSQFDTILINIKSRLNISQETLNDVNEERNRLLQSKKDIQNALQILLTIDNIKESLSSGRKADLTTKYKQRLSSFEEIKLLINKYHRELEAICEDNNDDTNGTITNINNEHALELGDNDLREHLLLDETKKNLEEASKNISETHINLINQSNRLKDLDHHLSKGEKDVIHSNSHLRQLSNRKFCIKLVLHLVVILLAIGIIAALVLKVFYMHNTYSKNVTSNTHSEVINQFEL